MLHQTSQGPLWVEHVRHPSASTQLVLWPGLFFDSTQHGPISQTLEAQVFLVDPPGFGRSPRWRALSVGGCAQAMLDLREPLQLESPVLGGTSWGGISAVHAARIDPDAVSGLVLINTPLGPGDPGAAGFVPELALLPSPLLALGAQSSLFGASSLASRGPQLRRALRRALATASPAARRAAAQAVMRKRPDLAPQLPRTTPPTLMICGAEDLMYPLEAIRAHADLLPDVTLEVIPGSGHSSALEHPEHVAASINAFLRDL